MAVPWSWFSGVVFVLERERATMTAMRAVIYLAVVLAVAVMAEEDESARTKRCANLMDDSCVNGQLPGSGGDGDYFESGSNPGKRSQPPRVEVFKNQMENQGKFRRCANLMDDSCVNGQIPGSGDDGDYFGSGSNPGKRSQPPRFEVFKNQMENQGKFRRCANLMDDSCVNGQIPGSGDDGDYFESGSNPGKRSPSPLLELFKNQMSNMGKFRRCANLMDDSCVNGQLPGSGGDGDYFESGSNPGKRSARPYLTIYQNRMDNLGKTRRCANLLDDSCINGQLPGSGGDGGYFGSGSNPGKRSLSLGALLRHRCALGYQGACRLLEA